MQGVTGEAAFQMLNRANELERQGIQHRLDDTSPQDQQSNQQSSVDQQQAGQSSDSQQSSGQPRMGNQSQPGSQQEGQQGDSGRGHGQSENGRIVTRLDGGVVQQAGTVPLKDLLDDDGAGDEIRDGEAEQRDDRGTPAGDGGARGA